MHRPLPLPTTPPRGLLQLVFSYRPLFSSSRFVVLVCSICLFLVRISFSNFHWAEPFAPLPPCPSVSDRGPKAVAAEAAPQRARGWRSRAGEVAVGGVRWRADGRPAAGLSVGRSGEVGPGLGPPRGLSFAVVFTRRRPRTPSRRQITKQKGGIVPFRFQFDRLEACLTPSARPTRPSPPTPLPMPMPKPLTGPSCPSFRLHPPHATSALSPTLSRRRRTPPPPRHWR